MKRCNAGVSEVKVWVKGWDVAGFKKKNVFQPGLHSKWNIPVAFQFYFFVKLFNSAIEFAGIARILHLFLNICKLWETERSEMKLCRVREEKPDSWKYLTEDKLVTALAISKVHDVQQLQFPLKLMNEQSLVILKMSLKVANCMK